MTLCNGYDGGRRARQRSLRHSPLIGTLLINGLRFGDAKAKGRVRPLQQQQQ